jgi:hypothetical protein
VLSFNVPRLHDRIGQSAVELANALKLTNSVVGYQRIGQFGELVNPTLQLSPKSVGDNYNAIKCLP